MGLCLKNKTKNVGDFKCTAPCFVIPRGLSTLYGPSLTTMAQSIPYHEKPFNQGLLQPQGALYPIHQTIIKRPSRKQLLEFRTRFHETISSVFLVEGTVLYELVVLVLSQRTEHNEYEAVLTIYVS